jgi:hypothetical protein
MLTFLSENAEVLAEQIASILKVRGLRT